MNITLSDLFPESSLNLIAGPCSAETEEQVLVIAKQLSTVPQIRLFRAGIWKPRTRPNSFEGVGTVGLKWLQRVKEETQLPVAVEVANPIHVEECLRHDVDVFWIGARTSVNPFMVQEIAESLAGTDVPVIVKNPINPDLQLWIGAIERLNKVGLTDVAALHRGFSVFQKGSYRNPPQWEIPIELMRLRPDILMLCDPSHICGNRELLRSVGQQALDLRMRGLMIETHPDPDQAWSDAQQQITAFQLQELISQWIIRKTHFLDAFASAQIENLRNEIDELDSELLDILMRRKKVVEQIAQLKERQGVQIYQPERWQELVEKANLQAQELGLDPVFLHRILSVIHNQAIDDQAKIMNADKIKSGTL